MVSYHTKYFVLRKKSTENHFTCTSNFRLLVKKQKTTRNIPHVKKEKKREGKERKEKKKEKQKQYL